MVSLLGDSYSVTEHGARQSLITCVIPTLD